MNKRIIEKILSPLPDECYIKIKYLYKLRKNLNISTPRTFNEKIQWLKLHDRKDEYSLYVDKVKVKEIVSSILGNEYVIPTYAIWDNVEDIDFDVLPNCFAIKPSHDSGGCIICKDKEKTDLYEVKEKLAKAMKDNYYYFGREWPYKNIRPRIIAEKLLNDGNNIKDYKVFCFNGKPRIIQVDIDRFSNHCRNMYDTDWNYLGFSYCYPSTTATRIDKPVGIRKMIQIATELSRNFKFLRVDMYEAEGKVYFGEMTLYPESGFGRFIPEKWDNQFGDWLDIN